MYQIKLIGLTLIPSACEYHVKKKYKVLYFLVLVIKQMSDVTYQPKCT